MAQRARILLLAAQGHSNTEIGRLVGVSLPTVRLWRSRYGAGGVGGLGDLARSGRPARARGEVDHRRDARSAAGAPRGDALVGPAAGPPPRHQLRDGGPDLAAVGLEAKIRDVVGLYLDPPAKAVVVCIDEKTQIQALDRTAPPRSCRSAPGCPRSRRATTSATAQRHCSPGWRSRPAWSRTAATSSTRTSSY